MFSRFELPRPTVLQPSQITALTRLPPNSASTKGIIFCFSSSSFSSLLRPSIALARLRDLRSPSTTGGGGWKTLMRSRSSIDIESSR